MHIDILNQILLSILGDPKLAKLWWNSPNKAFNEHTPLDVYTNVETKQQVVDYLLKYV